MRWTIALLLLPVAAPALAQQDDPLAPVLVDQPLPPPPAPPVRAVPKDWRGVFAAIRAEQWAAASAGIDA